jgi:hypothetical protein
MNIEVLDRLKLIEHDHTLNILVINHNADIPMSDLVQLQYFGNVTIATSTTLMVSQLLGKLSGLKYNVVLTSRIQNKEYDVIIANEFTDFIRHIVTNYKIKYLCFLNFVRNFNLINYYEFEENCYKLTSLKNSNEINIEEPGQEDVIPEENENELIHDDIETISNQQGNYEVFIKDIASTPIKYDKYRINYLYPVVPGKISIVMIVSALNNNFAEVLRDIRSQNLALIEYIIIDNAAGFRNNVKPNIRYGERMPIEFCEYHAKEISTGEYIITLKEDSEPINVMAEILQGKFETR